MMRKPILAALTFALASLASPLLSPAGAADFPYCAMGTSTCAEACDFATLEQCRAFIAGDKGYCQRNPRASGAQALLYTPRPRR